MKKYSILLLLFISLSLITYSQDVSISGSVTTIDEEALCNAKVTLFDENGDEITSMMTDQDGDYFFDNLVNEKTYHLTVSRDIEVLNGISTFDVVMVSKYILGTAEIDDPRLLYSLDVDNSSFISVRDMVFMRRVILGIDAALPVESWQFFSSGAQIEDNEDPWATANIQVRTYETLSSSVEDANFIGFKTGDANRSTAINCN